MTSHARRLTKTVATAAAAHAVADDAALGSVRPGALEVNAVESGVLRVAGRAVGVAPDWFSRFDACLADALDDILADDARAGRPGRARGFA